HIEYVPDLPVRAGVRQGVGEVTPVVADGALAQGDGAVPGQGVGIQQHAAACRGIGRDEQDGLILQAVVVGIEPVPAVLLRRAPTLEIPDLLQPLRYGVPAWNRRQITRAELALRLHPRARLR